MRRSLRKEVLVSWTLLQELLFSIFMLYLFSIYIFSKNELKKVEKLIALFNHFWNSLYQFWLISIRCMCLIFSFTRTWILLCWYQKKCQFKMWEMSVANLETVLGIGIRNISCHFLTKIKPWFSYRYLF